jgi:hypothetical protein
VHEWGALCQARLAANLCRHGVAVALDRCDDPGGRPTPIPGSAQAAFSKRTMTETEAARDYAAGLGLDWDTLDAERRIGLPNRGVQGDPRQAEQVQGADPTPTQPVGRLLSVSRHDCWFWA